MRLGSLERGVEARLVDRAVHERRRRARGSECAPRSGRDPFGGRDVEAALQREDVPLEPGEEVHAGAEPGVGQLRQVRVEVDHAGHEDPRPQVDDLGGRGVLVGGLPVGVRPGERDPPGGIDLDEPVRFEARATRRQRRE